LGKKARKNDSLPKEGLTGLGRLKRKGNRARHPRFSTNPVWFGGRELQGKNRKRATVEKAWWLRKRLPSLKTKTKKKKTQQRKTQKTNPRTRIPFPGKGGGRGEVFNPSTKKKSLFLQPPSSKQKGGTNYLGDHGRRPPLGDTPESTFL